MNRHRKVALIQSICPHYRVPFFARLAGRVDLTVLHGRGDREGAWRNAERIEGFVHQELRAMRFGLRRFHPYLKVSWIPGLFRALRRLRPELVVSEGLTSFPNTLAAYLYCRSARIPFVVWDAGRRSDKPMPLVRKLLEPINSFLLTRADACIGYGSVARASFLAWGVQADRIFVAQNSIDVEAIQHDRARLLADRPGLSALAQRLGVEGHIVFLYVGAIEARKRLEDVVTAMRTLRADGHRVAVLIVGDGPHLPALRAFTHADSGRGVVFAGRVTDGVGAYHLVSDIAVLPGPGGLSINLAMAYGLPVVVRGGDGTEEDLIDDGVSGWCVSTAAQMESRLRELVLDTALRERTAAGALASIGRYGLANMCDRFEAAMEYAWTHHSYAGRPALPAVE